MRSDGICGVLSSAPSSAKRLFDPQALPQCVCQALKNIIAMLATREAKAYHLSRTKVSGNVKVGIVAAQDARYSSLYYLQYHIN
jgi:hypothetical protein